MSFFDSLTSGAFKKDSQNRNLFFPWGIFGSGFIVESEERLNQIQKSYNKMWIVMLLSFFTLLAVLGFWVILLVPVCQAWQYFAIKKITKNLQRTTEKLKISETYKNSAKSFNLPLLILLELLSLVFVAAGVWIIAIGERSFMAYASLGFISLCAVIFGYVIFLKIKNKKSALEA